jgi:hypothetical protein
MAFFTCDHLAEDGVRCDSPAFLSHIFCDFRLNVFLQCPQIVPQLQSAQDFTYNYLWNEWLVRKTCPNPLILRISKGGGGTPSTSIPQSGTIRSLP